MARHTQRTRASSSGVGSVLGYKIRSGNHGSSHTMHTASPIRPAAMDRALARVRRLSAEANPEEMTLGNKAMAMGMGRR